MSRPTVDTTSDPSTAVIRWGGQLVVGNRHALKELTWDIDKNVIVDLRQTGYVDASGLGILVKIRHRLREGGKRLVLVGLSDDLRVLFELTKLNTLFETATDEESALEAIASGDDEQAVAPHIRIAYNDTDLLDFEQARTWWGCSARTLERMNLPWSFPTRARGGGRLRRIMFRDLVAHYERRKVG